MSLLHALRRAASGAAPGPAGAAGGARAVPVPAEGGGWPSGPRSRGPVPGGREGEGEDRPSPAGARGAAGGSGPPATGLFRGALWTAVVAAAVVGLPQLAGALTTPRGWLWTGGPDANEATYLAKMIWGFRGHWDYVDVLTPQPTRPAPVYTFYLLLGHLARWCGGSPVAWWEAARVGLGAAAVGLWYAYCHAHWPGRRGHLAFAFGLLAAPWGFASLLPSLFGAPPSPGPGAWWVGGHPLTILFLEPHYGLMASAFVGVVWCGEAVAARAAWRPLPALLACAGEAALALTYPWLAPLAVALPWSTVRRERAAPTIAALLGWSAVAGVGALPPGLLLVHALGADPWLRVWRAQSSLRPMSLPAEWLLVYGAVGWLGLAGVVEWLRRRERWLSPMAAWLGLATAAAYAVPLPNAREMMMFLGLPMGALAAGPVDAVWRRARTRGILVASLAVAAALPQLELWVPAYLGVGPGPVQRQPAVVAAAIQAVARRDPGAVVLADPATSLWLPVWSGDRVRPFVAHAQETLDAAGRYQAAMAFWRAPSWAARRAWLLRHGVRWVIWSPWMMDHVPAQLPWSGPAPPLEGAPGFAAVWRTSAVTVWHLAAGGAPGARRRHGARPADARA